MTLKAKFTLTLFSLLLFAAPLNAATVVVEMRNNFYLPADHANLFVGSAVVSEVARIVKGEGERLVKAQKFTCPNTVVTNCVVIGPALDPCDSVTNIDRHFGR